MKLQPRQQLLDIWKAVARHSFVDDQWVWGGRDGRNSIADAEQLLCLMYPATAVPSFGLDEPNETADDVLLALRGLGDSVEIPKRLIRVLTEYMNSYLDPSGAPDFSGGHYFVSEKEPSKEQRALHVVDSFSMSVTLTLATLGFLKVLRKIITRPELRAEADVLEKLASTRLTAAMVGLLRSFTVNVFDLNSTAGQTLRRAVSQGGDAEPVVLKRLRTQLEETRAGLRDLSIGSGSEVDLDNENLLFECGWSWGIVRKAPEIDTTSDVGPQASGFAQGRPYLYFTVVALDGIADLNSERTRVLGLLNEDQLRLAQALQLRWDLTRSYWATIASFGQERWPLEDIPWRTSDGEESDYYSLLVTSLVAQDLERRRASESDLVRVYRVLDELAGRGRIKRRVIAGDPAVGLHVPGVPLRLVGTQDVADGAPQLNWVVSDFAVMLLKRTGNVAALARGTELRGQLLELADDAWNHLYKRRLAGEDDGALWDDATSLFSSKEEAPVALGDLDLSTPSWYFTERVVEALVQMAQLADASPLRSARLAEFAGDMLAEAEQLYDQELLSGSMEAGPAMRVNMHEVRANLRRAREIQASRPGTSFSLTIKVLRDLDTLAVARQDAGTTGLN